MRSSGHPLFVCFLHRWRQRIARRASARRFVAHAIFSLSFVFAGLSGGRLHAQSTSDDSDTIHGVVINGATREPIARALVSSPDNRFATLTNSEGRFEFTFPKAEAPHGGGSDANGETSGHFQPDMPNRPDTLTARKPGFLPAPSNQAQNFHDGTVKEWTITLIPETVIAGTVSLPTSEAPDSIVLQMFRCQVEDGRGRYVPAGGTQSMSDGQFRFAGLPAGTYKLVTHELLDNDPPTVDPRGALFGYPPVFYQNAPDFGSAVAMRLGAGQTQTVNISLVKQPYYRVRVPVIDVEASAGGAPANGVAVNVYSHGRKGPGFSLGYNDVSRAIEGMLPNGTYTIEASSFGPNGVTGVQTVTIKGAPIDGPSMTLARNASIRVNVKEEFTSFDPSGRSTWNGVPVEGPRRYLNVTLQPADDFGVGRGVSLRNPTGAEDEALVIEGAPAGSYWVQVQSARGYAASIRSGNLDLQHEALVVGAGGGASPIEITMRDDAAEISGTVDGLAPQGPRSVSDGAGGVASVAKARLSRAHIYCVPIADSGGQFAEIWVKADGSFDSPGLAPGAYRLLAFDQEQKELEYRNPDALRAFESKGTVVRLVGGQKEQVQLPLISASISRNEE